MNFKSIRRATSFLLITIVLFVLYPGQAKSATYDPYDFGAKGDGITNDTEAIQQAIDTCHRAGGGSVYLSDGIFRSGTLYLKDNVVLYLEAGTILRATDDVDDFPSKPSNYPSYQKGMVTLKAFIYAEDANNISIMGKGTIDGNGDHWVDGPYGFPSFSKRPRIIHFRGCENITIRDVTLYNAASWVQSYQSCRNMVIDGITVDSRPNEEIEEKRTFTAPLRNTDGLDLTDCEKVRISNCFIYSGDDGICLKSLSPDEACRDITITNCVVSTNASGIKIGTETSGTIEDITINNCVVYDTRIDAVSIMTVDGAKVARINISDMTFRNIKGAALFIRLGNRNRTYREGVKINEPYLKDITIQNIQGSRISSEYGCIIAGIDKIPVENVFLSNINLEFEGGGKAEESYREIPEQEKEYPNGLIFGKLPSYGFYIRHAKNITMENISLRFDKKEERPALLAENVSQLRIENLQAEASDKTPELLRIINNEEVLLIGNRPTSPVSVFLSVIGDKSRDIILLNNFLKGVEQKIQLEREDLRGTVKEINSVEY